MSNADSPMVSAPAPKVAPLLEMRHITKRFAGTVALHDVNIDLQAGEVHCLVGENGAGKSTLVKILAGSEQADEGTILLDGRPVSIRSPSDGLAQGIGVVYQELELVPDLSVSENVSLGREPTSRGMLSRRLQRQRAQHVLQIMGAAISPDRRADTLTVAEAQLVAIAKVLALGPGILVLDEPSAALAGPEMELLYKVVERLKADGVGIIYISHRMGDIFRIGDRVTVLRDGAVVSVSDVASVTENSLVSQMVGRKVEARFPPRPDSVRQAPLLEVSGVRTTTLQDASLIVHEGEILGCTGLAGAGMDALADVLAGAAPAHRGVVKLRSKQVRLHSPRSALSHGVALVPEDRKLQGLVLMASVADNVSYAVLDRHATLGVINQSRLADTIQRFRQRLRIRTASVSSAVGTLSGGNQQKVVVAKVLAIDPSVLVLDEPTRGIDVGAKADVYELIVSLAARGHGIIMMSTEMAEVTALSHRLLVMSEGAVVAEFTPPYDEEAILRAALPRELPVVAGLASEPDADPVA